MKTVSGSAGFDPLQTNAMKRCCDAPARFCSLLDHLVGPEEDRLRHRKAERLGGLEVHGHLKFGWHLNGQVGWLFASENSVHIRSRATVYVCEGP
jgi:hypothetical protein